MNVTFFLQVETPPLLALPPTKVAGAWARAPTCVSASSNPPPPPAAVARIRVYVRTAPPASL